MSGRLHWLHWKRGGVCYWCKLPVVLPKHVRGIVPHPPNMATLDHLFSRRNPARNKKNGKKIVMACFECNQIRNHIEQLEMFSERKGETHHV